jgi:hypothetical protein
MVGQERSSGRFPSIWNLDMLKEPVHILKKQNKKLKKKRNNKNFWPLEVILQAGQ